MPTPAIPAIHEWLTPAEIEKAVGAKWVRSRRIRIIERLARDDGITVQTLGDASHRLLLVNRAEFESYLADLRAGRRPAPDWWLELPNSIQIGT